MHPFSSSNFRKTGLILSFILIIFSNCQDKNALREVKSTRMAMGTIIEITVLHSTESKANEAMEAAFAEINRIGKEFYEGNPESEFYQFNHRTTDVVSFDDEKLALVRQAVDMSQKTAGAFDITAATLFPLYRFHGDSLRPPRQKDIDRLLPYVGYSYLQIDIVKHTLGAPNRVTAIGTGGIAKGYAVDRAIDILIDDEVTGAIVNAGGDLRVLPRRDGKAWRVGIQDPRNLNSILKILEVYDGAVVTSGDYQKFFIYEGKRYHHILNPQTGTPADSCRSVTVIAPTAEQADAMATGLFINGPEWGLAHFDRFPGCDALWIRHDGKIFMTDGFQQHLSQN